MHNDSNDGPNPSGLCMCGCGEKTRLAPFTRLDRGWVAGEPLKYVFRHGMKGRELSDETRAKMSAAVTGSSHSPEARAKISSTLKGRPHPKGEASHSWKGGVMIDRGRKRITVGVDHPMADSKGMVSEHRLVAAAVLGRPLVTTEHVHHIDLSESNDPENLAVLTNVQHKTLHWLITKGADPLDALRQVGGCPVTEPTPRPPRRTPAST